MGWLFGSADMVTRDKALPGRAEPINPHPGINEATGHEMTGPWPDGMGVVIVGMGCFWGAEKLFDSVEGVYTTAVGYAGGYTPNPTYEEVCTGRTGHAEVVRVVFDPTIVSLDEVMRVFLEHHDPTQGYRQGNDVGTQYRSVVLTTGSTAHEDSARVQAIVDAYAAALAQRGFGAVTTTVAPLSDTPTGKFYLAEQYHQQYLLKNPGGYCPDHSTGVACRPEGGHH